MTEIAATVLTEARDGVLVITLNRPEAMNAVNGDLAAELTAAVARLDGDADLSVGVLTGAGRGFSAGMDLKAFVAGGAPPGFAEFLRRGAGKPLVAAIEGFALAGGLEIALACDILVAARGAKLGVPEVKVGLFAAGGAILRLPDRLPYGLAMEMALTGDPMAAERAYEHGLLSRLTEPGGAVAAAVEIAGRIAGNAPLATAMTKRLVRASRGLTDAEFWDMQDEHVPGVFDSADAREGATAFTEKRPPRWTGR